MAPPYIFIPNHQFILINNTNSIFLPNLRTYILCPQANQIPINKVDTI